MKYAQLGIIVMGLLLSACDEPADSPVPKADEQSTNVFDSQIKALQKTRQAEESLRNKEEEKKEKLEQVAQ